MTYSKAYSLGRMAYQEKVDWKHNPFPRGSAAHSDWKLGYNDAILDELNDGGGERPWIARQFERITGLLRSR